MAELCARDERALNSWEYGDYKGLFLKKGAGCLTVTDRRLIASGATKNSVYRDDIELDNIAGVYTSYKTRQLKILIIFAVLWLCYAVFFIVGPMLVEYMPKEMMYYGAPGSIATSILCFYLGLKHKWLTVIVMTEAVSTNFICAASTGSNGVKKYRFVVNEDKAKEITETLSAAVRQAKS